ncbi:IclR family transcriptional regulator [Leucobacter coleopterorum]|uniref:IclR family transcriptional regulator n=1 Tax=Leucobacter coleopterorum TaxID=2714933 RepID=A0ABX6JX55_9MICO|nr:IclR family transcriptional regulator [Leucobacter coleopterorum]QIM18895.1 IclR family transcriptional regulator [Leucobacter coleopterorum]
MTETLDSVERALEALRIFGADRREIGVTELAQLLGCSTSSAQRTIHTLAKLQFLRRDEHRPVYRLGIGVLHLARAWQSTASLASITRPAIERLAEETGLTASFAVADHAHMRAVVAVDGSEGPHRDYPIAGELFPAHVGAISKAYYAYLPRAMREHFTSQRPLARYTSLTSMNPEALEVEFAAIREHGYCVTQGEYDEQVSALAVPVQLSNDPLGSVTVSRRGALDVTDQLIAQTRATAQAIGRLLGRRG